MTSFQQTESYWQKDYVLNSYPPLQESLTTDVCIIGAGIAGLMTALSLLKQGHQVVIVERGLLGRNETGFTTAHLSDALDDGFHRLLKIIGPQPLQLFYRSHHQALQTIEEIITAENIQCDFQRLPGYLFLSDDKEVDYLKMELEAARNAGASDVFELDHADHGFMKLGPSICFPHQAQLHPLKFTAGLIKAIIARGGRIYEKTNAKNFHDDKLPSVEIDGGHTIQCKTIILATNGPTTANHLYLKQAAYRTYVLGLRIPKGHIKPALYWDTGLNYHYLRIHSTPDNDNDILLVGGEDHRVGEGHPEEAFENLKAWALNHLKLPEFKIVAAWSGQIMEPVDGPAFIGRSPGSDNIYFITGDSGHGFTHAAIASQLIPELMKSNEHEFKNLYSPMRISWKAFPNYIETNANTLAQYRGWISASASVKKLPADEGCVIRDGFHKIAIYKDPKGHLYQFSAVCPHLGGIVKWNPLEKTWDCPCHGSRFSKFGESLHSPATSNLEPGERQQEGPSIGP